MLVHWNPDQIALQLGPIALRWYSLFWTIGLAAAYYVVLRLYRQQKLNKRNSTLSSSIASSAFLLGARLGHCLLYEPHYFLQHPLEIFLPMRQDGLGHWHFTGFAGLASHGGTAGLMVALWLYVRKTKVPSSVCSTTSPLPPPSRLAAYALAIS